MSKLRTVSFDPAVYRLVLVDPNSKMIEAPNRLPASEVQGQSSARLHLQYLI